MWFTDAANSCGATLTRACVEKYMNRPTSYRARGLLVPGVSFQLHPPSYYSGRSRQCVSAAQWSNAAGKWITRASPGRTCLTASGYKYALTPPT
jgi:hypothetical protein